jgi:purine-binding chemotaxis protein CheW
MESKMNKQFSTFYIADRLYGLDVKDVQEVTKSLAITRVPLAPPHVVGLINLRGHLATAISLRELFGLNRQAQVNQNNNIEELAAKAGGMLPGKDCASQPVQEDMFNVLYRQDGILLSLLADQIGDVTEVPADLFEMTPETVPFSVGQFMTGVYKLTGSLLSILDGSKIIEALYKR